VLLSIRELYLLLIGVMSSIRAIFFGTILLFGMLVGFSIILVEWVHPANSQIHYFGCTECTEAFRSVSQSVLTLFKQLIAGDSWLISFPLFNEEPLSVIIMVAIVVTIMLGVINLILSVIIERAAEARNKNLEDMARHKAASQKETKKDLMRLCAEMDKDDSGKLTLDELQSAFDDSPKFRNTMLLLDVQKSDIEAIFRILDEDGSGDLDYEEFCEELIQLESSDQRTMLALTRLLVTEIRTKVEKQERKVDDVLETTAQTSVQLSAIDQKLDRLFLFTQANRKEIVPAVGMGGHNSHNSVLHPHVATAHHDSLGNMMEELGCAKYGMEHLAALGSKLAQEVEEQVAALHKQAALVASIWEMLPQQKFDLHSGSSNSPPETLEEGNLQQFRESVTVLSRSIEEQVSVIMHDAHQKISDTTTVITVNDALMRSMENDFAQLCNLPSGIEGDMCMDTTFETASPAGSIFEI